MKDVNLDNKKNIKPLLLVFTVIIALGLSLSAIYFMFYKKDSREGNISSGLINIEYTNKSSNIVINQNPVSDNEGLENTPYEFSVKNTSTIPIDIKIILKEKENMNIDLNAVHYALFIDNNMVKKDIIDKDNLNLYKIINVEPNRKIDCKVIFWVDYYYEKPNKTFDASIDVEGISRNLIK